MVRQGWLLALGLVVVALGCGDEDTVLLQAGMACNIDNDCAEKPVLLDCIGVGSGSLASKLCTTNCTSDAECEAIDPAMSCIAEEQKCLFTCPDGSRCPFNGMCIAVAGNGTGGKCYP